MRPFGFPKTFRLRTRAEFLKVQGRGRKIGSDLLLGLVLPNDLPHPRLGLTVSSKVGNSVERNRIRRRLRECFRKRREQFPPGVDVVLIARNGAASASSEELSRSFDQVLQKLAPRSGSKPGGAR